MISKRLEFQYDDRTDKNIVMPLRMQKVFSTYFLTKLSVGQYLWTIDWLYKRGGVLNVPGERAGAIDCNATCIWRCKVKKSLPKHNYIHSVIEEVD